MKKLGILALAALLVVAFTMPASAFLNEFGGYWRTRAIIQADFSGDESEAQDLSQWDTRTRLYYTAKFSDNFKFVNKFEFDAVWGDHGYGDIGADGKSVEVKNSYADFSLGSMGFQIGVSGSAIARGFVFDDDSANIKVIYKGAGFTLPFVWIKANEGGMGKDADDMDVDYFLLSPSFKLGAASVNPFFLYATSDDASAWGRTSATEVDLFYFGVNVDAGMGAVDTWFTGIYEGGDVDDLDVSAFLIAGGLSTKMGPLGLNAEVFYATGDDNAADADWDAYYVPAGQSYYWAEIMGYGIFDQQASAGSPADQIGNILAANIGASIKPVDAMKLSLNIWYAALAEDNLAGDDDLGTEVDLAMSYKLMKNLNLDLVAAYLFAGDATTGGVADDANPYELGSRISLSF